MYIASPSPKSRFSPRYSSSSRDTSIPCSNSCLTTTVPLTGMLFFPPTTTLELRGVAPLLCSVSLLLWPLIMGKTQKNLYVPPVCYASTRKDLVHTSLSIIWVITITYSCAREDNSNVPLRLPELLDCHLDYKEQEEPLSQKPHLVPKAEDLRKEKQSKLVPCYIFWP